MKFLGSYNMQVSETGWPVGQSLARRWPVPCVSMITGYVFFGRLARLANRFWQDGSFLIRRLS